MRYVYKYVYYNACLISKVNIMYIIISNAHLLLAHCTQDGALILIQVCILQCMPHVK